MTITLGCLRGVLPGLCGVLDDLSVLGILGGGLRLLLLQQHVLSFEEGVFLPELGLGPADTAAG